MTAEMKSKPVWVWLPGKTEPTRCGTFSWQLGLGQFVYDRDYLAGGSALALDPVRIPLSRSRQPESESKLNGLFGVFRDASPEGFGLDLLRQRVGKPLTDALELLELSEGDGVGAVVVCDDIESKARFKPAPLEALNLRLKALPSEGYGSCAVEDLISVRSTALGGERPKLTVLHKGQMWIAKVQSRGDAPNAPLREYFAMSIARSIGIDAAEVEFQRQGDHQTVLVRRFDRHIDASGEVQRRLFASAWTALQLDKTSTRGDDKGRSYVKLALELQRWCAAPGADVIAIKRELWRRMAFNAVCHNGDDHPRNHGLLNTDGRWALSPAYDIAPPATFGGTLAMDVTREGDSVASRWALLRECQSFGYEDDEASEFIDAAVDAVRTRWPAEVKAQGFEVADVPAPTTSWMESPIPHNVLLRRRARLRRHR